MIHPDTEVRFINNQIGYGVFATRPIPQGTIMWTLCRFDRVFTPQEASDLPESYQNVLAKYGYINPEGDFVLCWDNGRNVNHSCDPTMLAVGAELEIAVRDLEPGDQVTCEYGALNVTSPMRCRCGAPNCRQFVRASDVLRLWREWDRIVAASLPLAAEVDQPLLPFLRDPNRLDAWISGRVRPPSHREFYFEHAAAAQTSDDDLPWSLACLRS